MTRTEDLETKLAERVIGRETALALLESGFSQRETARVLDIYHSYVAAYAQGFSSVTAYQKCKARQRINPKTGRPFKSLTELENYQAEQRINPETGEKFKSRGDYNEYLVRQRTNPETGQPFKSRIELEEHLVKQRGFNSLQEYWSLTSNPLVLIVDVLMQAGRPLRMEEIYAEIADKYEITFSQSKRKIERAIERANFIAMAPIFAEENGTWSLNLGSPDIQGLGLEGRADGAED